MTPSSPDPSSHDPPLLHVPPRYFPDLILPPYTYVPGKAPHPLSDPAGHSYGAHAPKPPPVDDADWSQHAAYLAGIDLFNLGYYWEAHESWEAAWHAVGRRGPIADFLKGLIKLAAAGVKVREGRPAGVVAHALRAALLFSNAAADGATVRLGLPLPDLVQAAETMAEYPPPSCDDPPTVVRPLLPVILRPQTAA